MNRLPSVPAPALGGLFVWGGLLWALLLTLGCGGETNSGIASVGATSNTTATNPNTTGDACVCDSPTASCPGVVTGTVTDFDPPQPRLAGVSVEGDQSAQAVLTDTDGEYELEVNICRSPTTVRANLAGYCEFSNVLDISNERTVRNDIQLQERFVGGVVLDVTPSGVTGEPVSTFVGGIEVRLADDNAVNSVTNNQGTFLLEKVPQEGELTLVASEFRPEGDGCYESTLIERVQTCGVAEGGQVVELYCRDEANNGCGLCCTGSRVLPEGARPGDFCVREAPCAVGEEPVWTCNADLMGATCSCTACPEDNTRGEVCDGRDNDCDGVTDNPDSAELLGECEDVDGSFVTGCAEGRCMYTCETNRVDLNGDLEAGVEGNGCECMLTNGGVEVCDGEDNDCNGLVDDGLETLLCAEQQGVCQGAEARCTVGEAVCTEEDYTRSATERGLEYEGADVNEILCDGEDNNCNGFVDEHCCMGDPFEDEGWTTALEPIDNEIVQTSPAVAANQASGKVLLAWQQQDEARFEVKVASTDLYGTEQITEQPLSRVMDGRNVDSQVMDEDEGFLVHWRRSPIFEIGPDSVLWERFTAAGVPSGDFGTLDLGIGEGAEVSILSHRLVKRDDQAMLALWAQSGGSGDEPACENPSPEAECVKVRLLDAQGLALSPVAELTETVGERSDVGELDAQRAHNSDGFLVIWRDSELGELRWVRVADDLTPSATRSLSVPPGSFQDMQLRATEAGWLVVYVAIAPSGAHRLHYVTLDPQGSITATARLMEDGEADQRVPALAVAGDSVFLVWDEGLPQIPVQNSIRYAKLDSSARMQEGPFPLAEHASFFPEIAVQPLQEWDDRDRNIGVIVGATLVVEQNTGTRYRLGRVNPQGRLLCPDL